MRILYFNYLYDIRGASLGSAIKPLELFAALRQRGHEVEMVWFKEEAVDERAGAAALGAAGKAPGTASGRTAAAAPGGLPGDATGAAPGGTAGAASGRTAAAAPGGLPGDATGAAPGGTAGAGNGRSAGSFWRRWRAWLKRHFAFLLHDPKLLLENFRFIRLEAARVAAFKPDLIVARLDLYLFSALWTARRFGLPLIIEADSPPLYEAMEFQKQYWRIPALPRLIEHLVLRRADFAVMQSDELQNWFIRQHHLDPQRTAVVFNGADPDKFALQPPDPSLRARLLPGGGPVIGFIGSMSAWHGVDNLLQIVARLLERHPQAQFLLMGSGGGEEGKVQEFLRQRHLTGSVAHTGYVPYGEIPEYLRLMDVVLAPYAELPFFYYSPVKVYEYMASGRAVVTTAIGQLRQLITDGHDGLLCPPGDLDVVVAAVSGLLEAPERAQRMGLEARATITRAHTWKQRAEAWENICLAVLARHRERQGRSGARGAAIGQKAEVPVAADELDEERSAVITARNGAAPGAERADQAGERR